MRVSYSNRTAAAAGGYDDDDDLCVRLKLSHTHTDNLYFLGLLNVCGGLNWKGGFSVQMMGG